MVSAFIVFKVKVFLPYIFVVVFWVFITPPFTVEVSLTINGCNKNVTSSTNIQGIQVGTGKTLSISNVAEWSGFKTENGGALDNEGGTLSTDNVHFKNNTATVSGGAIYNNNITGKASFTL